MNLLPDSTQQEIITAAAGFLARELPVERLRTAGATSDVDRALWRKMGGLGWFALGVDDAAGGSGYSVVEEALLFRELGRVVAPGPYLATVLAAKVAARGETGTTGGECFGRLACGEATAGLAEPHRDAAAVVGATVTGRFRLIDGTGAEIVAVTDGVATALVDVADLRERDSFESVDPNVPVELVTLAGARAIAVAKGPALEARVLLSAALVGICEATRDQSVAYVGQREQFDKPIGSFQAVKHRCADMAVRAEAAGSLTWYAALSLATSAAARSGAGAVDPANATDEAEVLRLASFAKTLAGEYAQQSAADNIQNHGGMGFTAESGVHLYLRRALLWNTVLGVPAELLSNVLAPVAPEIASTVGAR